MNSVLLEVIKEKYPYNNTAELAEELNLSIYQLRRIVSKHKITKCNTFKNQLIKDLHLSKNNAYRKNIKEYIPSQIQENIIIGSLLGDGSLARYGRSKESHYREHGCRNQADYRAWKAKMLASLDFKYFDHYNAPCIKSPSNPLYSHYRTLFYTNERKQITPKILDKLNHPIGLLCLYLDDGTLVIDRYIRKNKVHLFPRITIYSQSFTKSENELLLDHIHDHFGVKFILKKRKDGEGFVLQCNCRDQIIKFLKIIEYLHPLLDCMRYKLDLKWALLAKKSHYQSNFPKYEIIIDRYE